MKCLQDLALRRQSARTPDFSSAPPAAAVPVPEFPTGALAPSVLSFDAVACPPDPAAGLAATPSWPASHSFLYWDTVSQNVFPCTVATFNSSSVGILDPSVPANVPAPQGEPPWTSVILAWSPNAFA